MNRGIAIGVITLGVAGAVFAWRNMSPSSPPLPSNRSLSAAASGVGPDAAAETPSRGQPELPAPGQTPDASARPPAELTIRTSSNIPVQVHYAPLYVPRKDFDYAKNADGVAADLAATLGRLRRTDPSLRGIPDASWDNLTKTMTETLRLAMGGDVESAEVFALSRGRGINPAIAKLTDAERREAGWQSMCASFREATIDQAAIRVVVRSDGSASELELGQIDNMVATSSTQRKPSKAELISMKVPMIELFLPGEFLTASDRKPARGTVGLVFTKDAIDGGWRLWGDYKYEFGVGMSPGSIPFE